MTTDQALLLSPPVNFAVVQLPERNYPGVVVQADTLDNLQATLLRALAAIAAGDLDEASAELEYTIEALGGAKAHLEHVCATRGISLPYGSIDPREGGPG